MIHLRLIMLLGISGPVQAQVNPFELALGMHENSVRKLVDPTSFEILRDKSASSDTEWRSERVSIYFCKGYVTAIHIPLHADVASFSRAVESERKVRGEPTFTFESRIWGSVEAKWRVEPYRFFSLTLIQYRAPEVSVDRWLTDIRPCQP